VPTVTFTGVDGVTQTLTVPMTRREIADLRSKRSELSKQLNSAADRRHRLSEEIKSAPSGASRIGLEERITVLDKRMVQLESDIAATGRQIAAAPQNLTSGTEEPRVGDIPRNVAMLGFISLIFVAFPIAIALARTIWRRGSRPVVTPTQLNDATQQRLERLEQGVDAIAIEIERVAEGQRFVTKLLSEGQHQQLRIGQASEEEKVRAGRD
jgi:septal ring factor EnvC (AmiA/AmiB activator)